MRHNYSSGSRTVVLRSPPPKYTKYDEKVYGRFQSRAIDLDINRNNGLDDIGEGCNLLCEAIDLATYRYDKDIPGYQWFQDVLEHIAYVEKPKVGSAIQSLACTLSERRSIVKHAKHLLKQLSIWTDVVAPLSDVFDPCEEDEDILEQQKKYDASFVDAVRAFSKSLRPDKHDPSTWKKVVFEDLLFRAKKVCGKTIYEYTGNLFEDIQYFACQYNVYPGHQKTPFDDIVIPRLDNSFFEKLQKYNEILLQVKEVKKEPCSLTRYSSVCKIVEGGANIANRTEDKYLEEEWWIRECFRLLSVNPKQISRTSTSGDDLDYTPDEQKSVIEMFKPACEALQRWALVAEGLEMDEDFDELFRGSSLESTIASDLRKATKTVGNKKQTDYSSLLFDRKRDGSVRYSGRIFKCWGERCKYKPEPTSIMKGNLLIDLESNPGKDGGVSPRRDVKPMTVPDLKREEAAAERVDDRHAQTPALIHEAVNSAVSNGFNPKILPPFLDGRAIDFLCGPIDRAGIREVLEDLKRFCDVYAQYALAIKSASSVLWMQTITKLNESRSRHPFMTENEIGQKVQVVAEVADQAWKKLKEDFRLAKLEKRDVKAEIRRFMASKSTQKRIENSAGKRGRKLSDMQNDQLSQCLSYLVKHPGDFKKAAEKAVVYEESLRATGGKTDGYIGRAKDHDKDTAIASLAKIASRRLPTKTK